MASHPAFEQTKQFLHILRHLVARQRFVELSLTWIGNSAGRFNRIAEKVLRLKSCFIHHSF